MEFEENLEDFENAGENPKASLVQRIYARTCNFLSGLKESIKSPSDSETAVSGSVDGPVDEAFDKYLNLCYALSDDGGFIAGVRNPLAIDFNRDGFEIINREKMIDIQKECRRCIIVLEFFTHCCINCIHSIEDIREVYEDLKNSNNNRTGSSETVNLKVVSVHSPKFSREKEQASIMEFTKRMQMDYSDVINDPESKLWNELGICCWPTVLVFGPNPVSFEPNLLFTFMGEGHKEDLKLVLESSMKYLKKKFTFERCLNQQDKVDTIADAVDGVCCESAESRNRLRYPGKVVYYCGLLGISDSGNNRVIIADKDHKVQYIIGGCNRGFKDGAFNSARFYNPQGLAFHSEKVIFVADTGNHAVRRIDIGSETVTTCVPPGYTSQLGDETVILKSPWDLAFLSESVLLIAAAGNHRIFGYFLNSINLFNSSYTSGACSVLAGSGREENRNNSYILKASFAQPSGICVAYENDGTKTVYIADSESSSVRSITSTGKVAAVVGGARDPTDLFAYGDLDGKGFDAKLQHPMGVCWSVTQKQTLFVVDTYNHKVKAIELGTKKCQTLIGNGKPGNKVGMFTGENENLEITQLNEPNGITMNDDSECLLIADTNNHDVKIANMRTRTVQSIKLDFGHFESSSIEVESVFKFNLIQEMRHPSDKLTMEIRVNIYEIPENFEGGSWRIEPYKKTWSESIKGNLSKESDSSKGSYTIIIPVQCLTFKDYVLTTDVFLCGETSCYKRSLKFLLHIIIDKIDESDRCNQNDDCILHSIQYSDTEVFK